MEVRDATEADVAAITDLYNRYLETTTAAWSERLQTVEERRAWMEHRQGHGFPVLVAHDREHGLAGFASYGTFRGAGMWPGYVHTVEHTIFVAPERCGEGVGHRLMSTLIERARAGDIHVMVGGIDGDNEGSIRFHEQMGFTEVGRMPEVGRKWGRWLDLVLVQRTIGTGPD